MDVIASAGARSISKAKASFWSRSGKWVSELVGMVRVVGLLSNFKSRDGCSPAAAKKNIFDFFFFVPKFCFHLVDFDLQILL